MASADFTIADVLAWARTKPAGERYSFVNSRVCAIAQFGLATDRPELVGLHSQALEEIDRRLLLAAVGFPFTFGAFVARLEKLVQETPVTPSEWTRLDAYLTHIELASA